jgi:hypothetical protein
MFSRRVILIGGVLLLTGVNLWYWWPRNPSEPKMSHSSAPHRFLAEDFTIRSAPTAENRYKAPRRDLFQPKAAPKPAPKKIDVPPPPPPKTPEELAVEAARAELAQIKLVGVVFRGGKGQAYFVKGEQAYLASEGDMIGERFKVETIAADSVKLNDPKTNVAGTMPVSGK